MTPLPLILPACEAVPTFQWRKDRRRDSKSCTMPDGTRLVVAPTNTPRMDGWFGVIVPPDWDGDITDIVPEDADLWETEAAARKATEDEWIERETGR